MLTVRAQNFHMLHDHAVSLARKFTPRLSPESLRIVRADLAGSDPGRHSRSAAEQKPGRQKRMDLRPLIRAFFENEAVRRAALPELRIWRIQAIRPVRLCRLAGILHAVDRRF